MFYQQSRAEQLWLPVFLLLALGALPVELVWGQGDPTIPTIDDTDPNIVYQPAGDWINNPSNMPLANNYGGLTFTNTLGATATYSFTGIGVAVYGAFPQGTFNYKSTYTLDGVVFSTFIPSPTNAQPSARQTFFHSGPIPNGRHTLVVTNLGEQFWFDFLQYQFDPSDPTGSVTFQPPSSPTPTSQSPTSTPTVSSQSKAQPASSQDADPSQTALKSSSATSTDASSNSQTSTKNAPTQQNTGSTTNAGVTSGPVVPSASPFKLSNSTLSNGSFASSYTSTSTSSGTANTGEPVGNAQSVRTGSPVMAQGAIIGVAVAGCVLLLLVVAAAWWWQRRRRLLKKDAIMPFDASETSSDSAQITLAGEKTRFISHSYPTSTAASESTVHVPDGVESNSSLYVPQRIDPHTPGSGKHIDRESMTTLTTLNQALRGENEETSHALLIAPEPHIRGFTALSPRPARRSTDGGVRIAGGPTGQATDFADLELRSTTSTLPPMYQLYPS